MSTNGLSESTGRLRREALLAIGVALALCAVLALMALVSTQASATAVGRLSWGAPVKVDQTAGLTDITCPSAELCVAADTTAHLLTSTHPGGGAPAWHVTQLPGDEACGETFFECEIVGISCPSSSFCAAADKGGYVFTSTDPAAVPSEWTRTKVGVITAVPVEALVYARQWVTAHLAALSCPSKALCVAVGADGYVFTSNDPTGGAEAWHAAQIDSATCSARVCPSVAPNFLDAISCPSVSACVAGDLVGNLLTSTDPTGASGAWSSQHVDNDIDGLNHGATWGAMIEEISCPSASVCFARDQTGNLFSSEDPFGGGTPWRTSHVLPPTIGLLSLECRSRSFCVGATYFSISSEGPQTPHRVALSYEPLGGAEWTEDTIEGITGLNAVSCPEPSMCVAVDRNGEVIVGETPVSRPPASVAVQKVTVRRSSIVLTIKASTAGTVTITGRGLKTSVKTLAAGSHQVKIALTRAGRAERKHAKRIKLSVTLKTTGKTVSSVRAIKL
jgi:hypothetical protein